MRDEEEDVTNEGNEGERVEEEGGKENEERERKI